MVPCRSDAYAERYRMRDSRHAGLIGMVYM
jgi:hypothetical protein